MFYTERLMLRTMEPEADLNMWTQWVNDVDFLAAGSSHPPMPSSKAKAKKSLESIAETKDDFPCFMICKRPEPGAEPETLVQHEDYFMSQEKARYPAIGILNVQGSTSTIFPERSVGLGISFDRNHRNCGYGTEIMRWALEYCFKTLGMHRVELNVRGNNEAALHVYDKLGFKREGLRRKKLWIQGQWHDAVEMGMLEEEYGV